MRVTTVISGSFFRPERYSRTVFRISSSEMLPRSAAAFWTLRKKSFFLSAHAAEALVVQAQRAGDWIGLRISISEDDNDQDPWALPPSRKRLERPIKEPLPERVQPV